MSDANSTTLYEQKEAKVYSFKSVGTLNTDRWRENPALPNEIPIGLKTPIRFGKSNDGLFMMNKKMSDQIQDNFRNMILTNHGERLGIYDFGANLEPLIHDLGDGATDSEAIRRIAQTTAKYMPYIELSTFEAFQEQGQHGLPNRVGIRIIYSVSKIAMVDKILEVVLWTGHETHRQKL